MPPPKLLGISKFSKSIKHHGKNHRKQTYKDYSNHRNKAEFRDAIQIFFTLSSETIPYIFFNDAPPVLFPQFNKERGM